MKKRNYVATSEQKLTTPEIAERPNSGEKKQKTEKLELTSRKLFLGGGSPLEDLITTNFSWYKIY